MYYVPDGTKTCGYYECKKCGNRFLSLQTMEKIPCPDCEAEILTGYKMRAVLTMGQLFCYS